MIDECASLSYIYPCAPRTFSSGTRIQKTLSLEKALEITFTFEIFTYLNKGQVGLGGDW